MSDVKSNIIISIPIVWSIRNFIYSDINRLLNDKYTVYYLIPEDGKNVMIDKFDVKEENLIFYENLKHNFLKSILTDGLQIKFKNFDIEENDFFKNFNKPSRNLRSQLKRFLGRFISIIFPKKKLEKLLSLIINKKISKEHLKKVKKINPEFILSTAHVSIFEQDHFLVYHRLGFKLIGHILSFDNLLSRGFIPLNHFSKILVWNVQMKAEAEKYYGCSNKDILITGTPQFEINQRANDVADLDYYQMKENSGVKILYCANHYIHTPTEPLLVEKIIINAEGSNLLKGAKWVVRLHPLDDYRRWNEFEMRNQNVIIDRPWENSNKNHWSLPPKEEFLKLGWLIQQSSLIINIASTITLDAISLNKPVICVGFSTENEAESEYYQKAYHSAHYKNITASGCFDLADDMTVLINLMEENIINPKKNENQRNEIKKSFLGMNDDVSSSEMIFKALCT